MFYPQDNYSIYHTIMHTARPLLTISFQYFKVYIAYKGSTFICIDDNETVPVNDIKIEYWDLFIHPYPNFNGKTDALPQDFVKSRSRETGCYNDRIALEFDRHLGSATAEVPVKFQSDWKSLNPNLTASRLHEILR